MRYIFLSLIYFLSLLHFHYVGAENHTSHVNLQSYQVRTGDSLSRIANKLADKKGDTEQWLMALYHLNQKAFAQCNINTLRARTTLNLPTTTQLSIYKKIASEFVQAQHSAWYRYRNTKQKMNCEEVNAFLAPLNISAVQQKISIPPSLFPTNHSNDITTNVDKITDTSKPEITAKPEVAAKPEVTTKFEVTAKPEIAIKAKTTENIGIIDTLFVHINSLIDSHQWLYWFLLTILLLVVIYMAWLSLRLVRQLWHKHYASSSRTALLQMSLRIRIFIIAILIIVAGQLIYSKVNVELFKQSYITSLQDKVSKMGTFLKSDIEYVINLGIPLQKLIKVEGTLKEILHATPELEFIEITDLHHHVLYYADHDSVGRIEDETQLSRLQNKQYAVQLDMMGLTSQDTDTRLTLYSKRKDTAVGYLNLRVTPQVITDKTHEILLDILTVILTSFLLTFEFLTFFVAYNIGDPLRQMVCNIHHAILNQTTLPTRQFLFIKELERVASKFNYFIQQLLSLSSPHDKNNAVDEKEVYIQRLQHIQQRLAEKTPNQATISQLEARSLTELTGKSEQESSSLQEKIIALQQRIELLIYNCTAHIIDLVPPELKTEVENSKEREQLIPYAYIRPLVFLFFLAIGLSVSFFPLFVNTLYEPLFGLSQEMMLGLPMSAFMIFFALSMLVGGSWTDYIGWRTPLFTGLILSSIGFTLTFYSFDIISLLVYRSLTGFGSGLVLIACQHFIIHNTSTANRSLGMAAFLTAFFSGDIVGVVVGAMLADRIGYHSVFLISTLFSLLALVYGILIFKHPQPHKAKASRLPFKEIITSLKDKEFAAVILFQAIPAKIALVGFLFYFVPIYLKHLGTLQSDIGRIIMCYGIAIVFLGPLLSKFFHNPAARKYYVLTGGILTGVSMLILGIQQDINAILFLVIMLGIAQAFSVSSQAALISETHVVKNMGAGTGMGVFRFWERIGNVVGPLVVAGLIVQFGYNYAIVVLGVLTLLTSGIYTLMMLRMTDNTLVK